VGWHRASTPGMGCDLSMLHHEQGSCRCPARPKGSIPRGQAKALHGVCDEGIIDPLWQAGASYCVPRPYPGFTDILVNILIMLDNIAAKPGSKDHRLGPCYPASTGHPGTGGADEASTAGIYSCARRRGGGLAARGACAAAGAAGDRVPQFRGRAAAENDCNSSTSLITHALAT
jgi:hypothetical protein